MAGGIGGVGVVAGAGGLAGLLLAAALASPASPPAPPQAAPGIPVTQGAAPGYVDDRACANCHAEIAAAARSSDALGMARSFFRPRAGLAIEDFAHARFAHPASRQQFALEQSGDRLVFRRWQLDAAGQPINVFERPVDYVLGSGRHARVYLYRTAGGELYQLPVAWYSQEGQEGQEGPAGRWGMAPGYDRPDHEGVLRRVRRECLFCHNAYPEVPAGSDAYGAPQVFPAELPEGIGCQRCHGPGGEHLRRASGGLEDRESVRQAIVNPARLPPGRGEDVCNQCHLQPEVALPMVRRFGRGDYSYRPGEALAGYVLHADLAAEPPGGAPDESRFEINHHAYRLRQSRCFVGSAGKLACWSCHDPHRRLPAAALAARVRATCLGCHATPGPRACKRPEQSSAAADTSDCAGCHLAKRRPRDVVHVVMTDHRIRRRPGGPELTAPRAESDPELRDVRLYESGDPATAEAGKLYLTLAVVRAGSFPAVLPRLASLLAAAPPADPSAYLELATSQLKSQQPAAAEKTLRAVLTRWPDQPQALAWRGVSLAALGRAAEAEAVFRQVLKLPGADLPETRFNLALLLAGGGRTAEAVPLFEQALAARANLVAGWLHLGHARARLGELGPAVAGYRRALEIDPTQTDAYLGLGRVLLTRGAPGDRAEAVRILTHGAAVARRPAAVAAALAEAQP